MANYTKTTNFAAKDALASGNANKVVKGTEINTEFDNIATAVATKADLNSPTLVTPALGTPSSGVMTNVTGLPLTTGVTGTLPIANGGTGASTLASASIVTYTGTETLTNKTLTTPVISTISNTGTITLPTSTDTLVGRATTDTLTNKTLTSPTLTTPALGTPASGVMTNVTGINYDGFKSRIINGAMVFDQRNAGASVTPASGTYTLDRWLTYQSVASKFSVQQNAGAVTPPIGFGNYLGATSLSSYAVLSSDYYLIQQMIEGFNTVDLAFGTVNAKTFTLSFWVYSSLTGTFGGVLNNSAGNRSYPFTYTISTANTWEQKTITVAGDTSGTWIGATNGIGLMVRFGLGVGITYSGTAGAWAGANYFAPTGATSVVGTSGATFYITGVQLEKGSTATSFDYRPYGTEFQLCQRYFQVGSSGAVGKFTSTTNLGYGIVFPIPMRSTPTVSHTANYSAVDLGVGDVTITNTVINGARITTTGAALNGTTTGATSGAIGIVFSNGVGFSSEL